MTTYIHYGSDTFIHEVVLPIRNSGWQTKPEGGLWASREDDDYGWKEWCEENHFELPRLKHSFRFTLPAAKILTLNTPDDLKLLPKLHPWKPKDYSVMFELEAKGEMPSKELLEKWFTPNLCYLDFEKLAEEYDAIELRNADAFHDSLGMWDCDSIVVFRPEVVELV